MSENRAPGLTFRNLEMTEDEPVQNWPFEAVLTALERGGLSHWRRIAADVEADPWGPVARKVEEAIKVSRPYGTSELMAGVVASARARAEHAERDEVARRVTAFISESGLSRVEFAARIGTSASRLSTYSSGRVSPSAALFLRMASVAARGASAGSAAS